MRQGRIATVVGVAVAAAALSTALMWAPKARGDAAAGPASADASVITERSSLTNEILAGQLDSAGQAAAVKNLKAIAARTIFNKEVVEGDPLAVSDTVQQGDTLASIMRRNGCHVPSALIQQINGIKDGRLEPGSTVKLLKGTVHGRLDKHQFTLDVYLQNGSDKALLRRVKVATGKNDATPEGAFRIGGKATRALWVPPKSMKKTHPNPVAWGQKGYPLGKDGLFMSLRGTDDATRNVKGYGIHGTNAQWSIGKAKSHGCIRVGDGDIGPIFNMFTEGASTVKIVP